MSTDATRVNEALKICLSKNLFHFDVIKELILQSKASPDTVNMYGDNLLHCVIKGRAFDLIPEVLALRATPENKNAQGKTALQCLFEHVPKIEERNAWMHAALELIRCGANPHTADEAGNNILHYAVLSNNLRDVGIAIARGVNLDHPNRENKIPLISALGCKPLNLDIVTLLVFAKAHVAYPKRADQLDKPIVIPKFLNQRSIDPGAGVSYTTQRIAPSELVALGEHCNNKERVLAYLEKVEPLGVRRALCNQALNETTPLGRFVYARRGFLIPDLRSGIRLKISAILKAIPAVSHVSTRASGSMIYYPAPQREPIRPSAPPLESASAYYLPYS